MVLVDTSVWIDFLRRGNTPFRDLLNDGEVATHPLVVGELHVGNISKRATFLALLENLPTVTESSHEEVLIFIETQKLHGKGLSYTDVHLLCSSIISGTPLWTLDKNLAAMAKKLKTDF